MAKEGFGILFGVILAALILTIGGMVSHSALLKIVAALMWIFVLFSFYFFRDPERTIPPDEDLILSAGDGKVVDIKEVFEDRYFHGQARKISIFLSVFDVHINRIPISGKVGYFEYKPGKFVQAFKPIASTENEQTIIGIENEKTKVIVKQIAGIIARRIVCHIREGYSVKRGARFGMIKFGSRVDLIIPLDAEVLVKLGDKVKGGETAIAKIHSK